MIVLSAALGVRIVSICDGLFIQYNCFFLLPFGPSRRRRLIVSFDYHFILNAIFSFDEIFIWHKLWTKNVWNNTPHIPTPHQLYGAQSEIGENGAMAATESSRKELKAKREKWVRNKYRKWKMKRSPGPRHPRRTIFEMNTRLWLQSHEPTVAHSRCTWRVTWLRVRHGRAADCINCGWSGISGSMPHYL